MDIYSALDLVAIRRRALKAGGANARWRACEHTSQSGRIDDQDGDVVVYDEGAPTGEQAAHIAGMDPATTLILLNLIDELSNELSEAQRNHERWIE